MTTFFSISTILTTLLTLFWSNFIFAALFINTIRSSEKKGFFILWNFFEFDSSDIFYNVSFTFKWIMHIIFKKCLIKTDLCYHAIAIFWLNISCSNKKGFFIHSCKLCLLDEFFRNWLCQLSCSLKLNRWNDISFACFMIHLTIYCCHFNRKIQYLTYQNHWFWC